MAGSKSDMDNLSDQDPGLIAITLVYKLIITLFNMAATARQERELKTRRCTVFGLTKKSL